MATATKPAPVAMWERIRRDGLPVAAMLLGALVLWYLGAIWMNAAGAIERVLPSDAPWTWQQLVAATMDMQRPVVPTPHQVAFDFWSSLVDWPLDSPRNLLFHVAVPAE